ncbi:hypothetical protein [Mycobacterium sp. NPDC050853]|uniref:hypothetical protein n=1 Tax=Mycobacterium sp. NPDC050853 TaxID=3155160 RepID=UPI0033E4096C
MIAAESALGIVFGLAAEFLRGAAASGATVCQRLADQRSGFSESEASEFLEGEGPDEFIGLEEFIATAPPEVLAEMARQHTIVDAEVHCPDCNCPTVCGCGREMYSERDRPGSLQMWFHSDDHSPVTADCANAREGLADRISAIRSSCAHRGMSTAATDFEIARDLLADYRITKK